MSKLPKSLSWKPKARNDEDPDGSQAKSTSLFKRISRPFSGGSTTIFPSYPEALNEAKTLNPADSETLIKNYTRAALQTLKNSSSSLKPRISPTDLNGWEHYVEVAPNYSAHFDFQSGQKWSHFWHPTEEMLESLETNKDKTLSSAAAYVRGWQFPVETKTNAELAGLVRKAQRAQKEEEVKERRLATSVVPTGVFVPEGGRSLRGTGKQPETIFEDPDEIRPVVRRDFATSSTAPSRGPDNGSSLLEQIQGLAIQSQDPRLKLEAESLKEEVSTRNFTPDEATKRLEELTLRLSVESESL